MLGSADLRAASPRFPREMPWAGFPWAPLARNTIKTAARQNRKTSNTRWANLLSTGEENRLKEKLQEDLKLAMKSGDKLRVMTLRGALTEITRLEKDVRRPANENEVVQILKRERARRDEAIEFARKGSRQDLVDQNLAEAQILEGYLPVALGPDEIKAAINAQIAAGVSQIGPIMKALREQFGARLDGKMASELVKQALASV